MEEFSIDEALKARYASEPPMTTNLEKAVVFESIYESAIRQGPGGTVLYNCSYPKYEFLDFLIANRQLLLHGSNNPKVDILKPLRLSTDSREWANQRAIYACSNAIFPIFYAILDRRVYAASLLADAVRVRRGSKVSRYYRFAIVPEMLRREPWTNGMVYIVGLDSFEQLRNEAGEPIDEWVSRKPVPVLAKLPVSPRDFPYLRDVQAHETARPADSTFETTLDQALYESCQGDYQAGPELQVRIVGERGRLFAQAAGYPSVELRPQSPSSFVLSSINGSLTFLKNDDGEVTGLQLQFPGQKLAAVKLRSCKGFDESEGSGSHNLIKPG